ncbi:synergin gamma isoform X9 [Dunckerocampus dactyliophorus]|uniref:synergin gamma isoform X9 n=1 Tax=Dunckerocampus dactyliophorus TaxID=161453 RepID=UPI0024068DC3|nr:synergin gamma isoform X9 [Dunckerocampus dactyliophorus]
MALRPGSAGGGSFMYPVGGGLGLPQGMVPMQQQQQQQQQQQAFPMVQVMQPNMQSMMGMNYGGQMPPGAMPMQGGMAIGMQTPGMPFLGQPQFMGMRPAGPQYTTDMQKQMAEEHQKRLEQQQKMLEEDRKRRQFEEQKQKLRLLSSVKPKTGEKSRDDALEAIKGNLDGFSRDAKMHPTPSSQSKKPDSSSSSSSHSSVTTTSLPPSLSEASDEFSDFQGPVDTPGSFPTSSSSSTIHGHLPPASSSSSHMTGFSREDEEFSDFVQVPLNSACSQPSALASSMSLPTATQPSAVNTSSQSAFQGPSLEEKLFSSCNLTAHKTAQMNFKSKQSLTKMSPRAKISAQFQASSKARNWATATGDFGSIFIADRLPEAPVLAPGVAPSASEPHTQSSAGVGVYPQQEHIQSMLPSWLYNDSLIPEMFKKVLEFTMTPAGIDTAKLYPLLMSSGLPREALGQIWASANRTTPGMLTKEELYTVLALIAVAQSGLPAMNVEILSQFPSPPMPNLPALSMAVAPVMPQHQQPMMTHPPVSMAMSIPAPTVMAMTPAAPAPATAPANTNFIASFPPAQGTKVDDDDDFQDFQEAPKAGVGDQAFTDFQGESSASFPISMASQHQNSAPSMLTPLSGTTSASSDKYAVFKQLSVDQPTEATAPTSDGGDKYSVFRQLEPPADKKPLGEGFADFKSVRTDDGFTDFKTADSVSPLDPSEPAKIFQPCFPSAFPNSLSLQQHPQQPSAVSLSQAKNSLNMADLDLFSSVTSCVQPVTDTQTSAFPSVTVPPSLVLLPGGAKPPGGGTDEFGDFALFGSSCDATQATAAAGGAAAAPQDDFADFMAFGSSGGEPKGESSAGVQGENPSQQQSQQRSDKYDVFKQLSLDGGLAYDDTKETGGGSFSSLKSDTDDFADFQSSKFCTALGASEKTLVDKVAAFKQGKEDCVSVKSLDLPSIGGSSMGKDDSEDALSVQLDMKLTDMGGDLKHVMSDSSLDLPGLSSHQPPATGSHKRSHSLGEKEIGRSPTSLAPEQPFRDRSNTLSEKPTLPVIRDKYKDLTGEVEESERYAYEWQRCLESALEVITKANNTLNGISSSSVCTEVIQSAQGMEYLLGVVEVYRVTRRVELGIKATAVCSEKLQQLLKDVSRVWNNLTGFMSLAKLAPDEPSLDFTSCILRHGIKNAKELACGLCLLNVDSRSKSKEESTLGRLFKRALTPESVRRSRVPITPMSILRVHSAEQVVKCYMHFMYEHPPFKCFGNNSVLQNYANINICLLRTLNQSQVALEHVLFCLSSEQASSIHALD